MSERWKKCPFCQGCGQFVEAETGEMKECGLCGGQGFNGDIRDYLQKEAHRDWENNNLHRGDV